MTLLGDLVGHIFFLRAEIKMVGVDAGPHVAAMANEQAVGDGTAIRDPRGSVRLPMTPFEVEASIAVGRATAGPKDAAGLGITDAAVLQALLQRPVARTKRTHRMRLLIQSSRHFTRVTYNHLLRAMDCITITGFVVFSAAPLSIAIQRIRSSRPSPAVTPFFAKYWPR
jgi:hypothetical protein